MIRHPAPLSPKFTKHKKYLVYRLGHLGDLVLSTGVLHYWGKQYSLRFHILTRPSWAPLFEMHPYVDNILSIPENLQNAGSYWSYFHDLANAYKDWGLIDLHRTWRSLVLAKLWKGPIAAYPKMTLQRRLFLASGTKFFGPLLRSLPIPQRYALALCCEAPNINFLQPQITLRTTEIEEARKQLPQASQTCKPIAIHPFATHPWKSWPLERWSELAAELKALGLSIIIIGKGKPLLPEDPFDFTNKTSLRQSCALLSHCAALISGDSGPMHLARAVGTPVLALFGPTSKEWGFYPDGPYDCVLESDLPCRPCSLHGKTACPYQGACLRAITIENVLTALKQLLYSAH